MQTFFKSKFTYDLKMFKPQSTLNIQITKKHPGRNTHNTYKICSGRNLHNMYKIYPGTQFTATPLKRHGERLCTYGGSLEEMRGKCYYFKSESNHNSLKNDSVQSSMINLRFCIKLDDYR